MSNQKAISIVYGNSWGLRIGQILLWALVSLYLSVDEIATYGLWIVLVGAVGIIRLEGFSLGILSRPKNDLQDTIFSAAWLHVILGILLGTSLFVWNKEIAAIFRLDDSSCLIRLYAFIVPISTLSQLGRRILQREERFVEIFFFSWYGFLAQIIGIALALALAIPKVLIIGFLSGEIIKSICFGKACLSAANGGKWDNQISQQFKLGLVYALNQIAVFVTTRGDIWLVSSILSSSSLAAYVLFKQFISMVKSSVLDPAEEFVLPLLGNIVKRPILPTIYIRIRRELNTNGQIAYLLFASSVLAAFYFLDLKYSEDYRLFAAMVGLAIVSMHSFMLGQLSVTKGHGGEIFIYKFLFALILLGCFWNANSSNLYLYILVVVGLLFLINIVFEWINNRLDWGVKDILFTYVTGMLIGATSFFELRFATLYVCFITVIVIFFWIRQGGLRLLISRVRSMSD